MTHLKNVDKSHLSDSTSTTTKLNETCSLNTSCDHLLHLDSPILSSELQDNSIVGSTEPESVPDFEDLLQLDSTCVSSQDTSSIGIEFLPEFGGQFDHANLSPTDVFPEHHEYEMFLLQKEIDAPYDNLSHQDTHVYEKQDQDVFLIHATNLSHNFSLPQFMAQHNCEDLNPTDTPSTVPTALQASSDHSFNPKCAHNLMATQCNQSQYLTLMKQICAHNPSASQVSQTHLSNSLTSPYLPDPGEHVFKRSARATGKQDFPVKWLKFIHASPKPRMTETPVQKPVYVAYSPSASMNYQLTINLHDGYPLLHILPPEEYIPPSLDTLCNLKPTMFHLGDAYLCPTKILLPRGDNGERLRSKVTRKVVQVIEKADGERVQNLSYILGIDNGKVEEIISYSQLVDHQEAAANEENEINDDLYKLRALICHQELLKPTYPNCQGCKYNVLVEWETGEMTYEPLSVLAADDPVTCAT